MHDYGIGYGKPPRATRFKPGTSGNPKGRPKCASSPLGEIVNDVLNAPVKYRENGRARTSSRREVALRRGDPPDGRDRPGGLHGARLPG